MSCIKISELVIYPIKSCRGISLKHATICPRGLLHDHDFLIVARKEPDAEWKTVDLKQCPALVHVQPSIEGSKLRISFTPSGDSITVDLEPDPKSLKKLGNKVMLWKQPYEPLDLGATVGTFFRDIVKVRGSDVRLCYRSDQVRPIASDGNLPPSSAQGGRQIEASMHAVFPLLIVSLSSLVELNSRIIEKTIEIERFRANIIISGSDPWDEDTWLRIDISSQDGRTHGVHVLARCGRCAVTTVDLKLAKAGPQPLKELRKYRSIDPGQDMDTSPVFGMYGGQSLD